MVETVEKVIKPIVQDPSILPEKFQRPEIWNYKVKKQNILYTTTSNDYGYNKPSIEEMPKQYFSTNHEFTRNLSVGGNYRNFGLNT
ncbi:hypothetical protein H8356DRAFT_1724484 [Neocallimastix lanati (nom. inval.)]|uniref:Uncharacterized protein n=1 Tax=Neocallimastix californiae TaxID=1754190 RepID=A0A1Y2FFS6_9FUNG|nr:hypothetical protein H8356DRAFT_1724484 [Neocallimastix sp. JGI-2020a]ORY82762.1 hypothetical protein LY90DRAFT_697418 [Neocallimastix californiae]|eukprot:ORY82762.1 hypothetical protein LY90DRAFT_697418 [Neocallimastix californiae]